MGERETFLDDALPALRASMKGKIYAGQSEIYRVNDFGDEYRGVNNERTGMAHVDILWVGRPIAMGGWFTSSRLCLADCYGDRKATPKEIKIFEAAEKRHKEGKLETAAEMEALIAEVTPEAVPRKG